MVRKIPWFLLAALVPYIAWGQTIGGTWSGKISLIPTVGFNCTTLELSYSITEGWKISSISDFFGTDGWVWQEFGAKGSLGPVNVEFLSLFGPKGPVFLYAQSTASFSIAGFDVALHSAYVGPDVSGIYFSGGPSGGTVTTVKTEVDGGSVSLEAGFGARLTDLSAPFTITYTGAGTFTKAYEVDPFPGGLEFTYFKLSVEDLAFLCCGITLDFAFAFTKTSGFDYVRFALDDLFSLCCGISFGIEVEFGTDYKRVTPKVSWEGVDACVTVYGDLQFDHNVLDGWELYGFGISCKLGECYGLEFLTAFDVAALEEIIGDVFAEGEFEYVKLTVCGPACCGETWDLGITVFFQDTTGPLFGVSRLVIENTLPLMANFSVTVSFEIAIPDGPSLDLGWEFEF